MATKKKASAKKSAKKTPEPAPPPGAASMADIPASNLDLPIQLEEFIKGTAIPKGFVNPKPIELIELRKRTIDLNVRATVPLEQLLTAVNRIKPAAVPIEKLPEDVKESVPAL